MTDIHNYDSELPRRPEPGEKTWDTTELQRDFEVRGIAAPLVIVVRRRDRVKGHLKFTHSPRVYFDFQPSDGTW